MSLFGNYQSQNVSLFGNYQSKNATSLFGNYQSQNDFLENKESNNEIQIEAYVNESYAETYIKQIYFNTYSNPVELSVEMPNKKGVQFVDFEVEIKDKKVKSKLITKEKAEEKYSDAIAAGNTGIYSEYNKVLDKYIVHLGNIEPNTKVHFKSHFLQSLISNDLNYLYRLMDQFPFPKFSNNYFQCSNYIYKIKVIFQTSSPITILEQKIEGDSPTIRNRFNEDKTRFEIELLLKEKNNSSYYISSNKKNSLLSFEFQIKDFKKPKLYKQYDPKNNETTYLLSYFKTIYDDEENFNNNEITKSFPGLYYFLIDQSGSMTGRPIQIVIHTLKIFMQSLSKGSYYQLIGFGSNFKAYSEKPLLYNKENVKKTINEIEQLKGDMGGTYLYQPLEYIYNNCKTNENLHLPQHIFILTDGETMDKEQVLNIIEKNNSKYQVYANGIGNDFDYDFIRTAGECGFGASKFINDIENLSAVINEQLRKCMRSYYDKVKFQVEKNNNNEIIYDFYRNEFILENQLVNYSFIMKGKTSGNIEIKNKYTHDGKDLNEIFKFNENNILNLKDGDILAKITIHSLIQKGEGEDFSNEEKIKKIAKKYQVLCQYTSLYAEVENSQENKEANLQIININNNDINNSSLFSNNYHGGGLFGNSNVNYNNNNNNNNASLFGNNNNKMNPSPTSLFNNKNMHETGHFGNNNSKYILRQHTSSLFGNINNNSMNPNSSSLFGNNNNNDLSPRTSSLFADNSKIERNIFNQVNSNQKGNSLFEINNNNEDKINTGQSLFGNCNNKNEENNSVTKELFGNNNINKDNRLFRNNEIICFSEFEMFDDLDENIDDNHTDILENIIMSLDIIEGCWEENEFTNSILNMKSNIYNQVKNIVGNNKIAVTFVILFYILNDKKEKIFEYSNIIAKAKAFLSNNSYSYEFIISKLNLA